MQIVRCLHPAVLGRGSGQTVSRVLVTGIYENECEDESGSAAKRTPLRGLQDNCPRLKKMTVNLTLSLQEGDGHLPFRLLYQLHRPFMDELSAANPVDVCTARETLAVKSD